MSQDIDAILRGWEFEPGTIQARLVRAGKSRQVIQMRIDLGILQLETTGRPDGTRPHGCDTYFDHLRRENVRARRGGKRFVMDEEECQEADREFVQFYHRRVCWLALREYAKAIADADHTLTFMDFVRKHSPDDEYTEAHEQYRGFVLFQRTQACAALAAEQGNAEAAIDEIRTGLDKLRDFFAQHDAEGQMDDNSMVRQLKKMENSLREAHGIEATLREQLDRAVANEEYEVAARLRDELRQRGEG